MATSIQHMIDDWGNQPEFLISYLPLSHIAAQVLDSRTISIHDYAFASRHSFFFISHCFSVHLPMVTTALCSSPCSLTFARPDALKGSLGESLRAVRPTLFFGVPRVWEKFAEKIQAAGKKSQGLKKKISAWAKGLGKQAFWSSQVQSPSLSLSLSPSPSPSPSTLKEQWRWKTAFIPLPCQCPGIQQSRFSVVLIEDMVHR